MRIAAQTANRIFDGIRPKNQCWEWAGPLGRGGYGQVWAWRDDGGYTTARVHRLSYELLFGAVPDGLELDHLCRNRRCYNPWHLEAVTARENVMRSDGPAPRNARKTHCIRGHPLVGGNLATDKRPWRMCRQCRREKDRERKKAIRRERGMRCAANFIPPLKPLVA